ncbi:MAG: ATP-binding protein [Phycisphaeraceae bacterium]
MLVLNIIQGPDKGRQFELPDDEPQLIGRSSEALPLTDPTISRRHAELTPDDGNWVVHDLSSANGTYVNGTRIMKPTVLRAGDQVRTGSTLFVFGRTPAVAAKPVRVLAAGRIDASVEATVSSNDDSLIMASPEPSAAAAGHLKILYDLMQLIGSIFDRQLLLERVMDLVFEHFAPDRGFVLLGGPEDLKPEPVVVRYRMAQPTEEDSRFTVSRTIVQHVMTRVEGVLSSNAMSDRRFSAGESIQAYGIRSAICVPLKFRERIFGVIYIDSKIANYTFTEDQLRLMTAIGAQTGLALANADLYQQGLAQARLAAVGETVASLSHSIRNMLQALRGGAEVVELGLRKKDLECVSSGWEVLSRNLDRIFDLTMNMLAFSKQRKPEFDNVDLAELVKEVSELMRPQFEKRNVKLITNCHPELPMVPADVNGLHQVIVNLLGNALDAVEPEDGCVTLECSFDEGRQRATILVSDNGEGIEEENLKQVFTPFYSTKGLRGTGLGLAVAKKIIQEHGGAIDMKSETGQGTRFTITLSAQNRIDPAATAG